jgi:hypothetical protein
VSRGVTFHAVNASEKVAVDPQFDFDVAQARLNHPEATYHEITSDDYFGRTASPSDRFEVIFLDGLHTLDQTLRDFANAIRFLSEDGVIVIDDVVPESHFAAIKDVREFRALRKRGIVPSASWMGDVYRMIWFIETFFQQFSYRTVADNHGQLVVWPTRRESVPERTVEAVARAPFEAMLLEPEALNRAAYGDIVAELTAWMARRSQVSGSARV